METSAGGRKIYWLIVSLLVLAYLFLVTGSPLTIRGWSNHDDLHFLRMAYSLLRTGWFGPYDQMTLMKGPVYPMFIAANFVFGLPLLFTKQLAFVAGCIALAGTLTLYLPRAAALLCFTVVLFHPITFTPEAFAGMRTEIYLAWTLMTISGWLALPVGAGRWTKRTIFGVGIAVGIAFSTFWLTREEGLWLVPAMIVFAIAFLLLYWWRGEMAKLRCYLLGIVAFALTFAVIDLAISTINYRHYRFFGPVDIRAPGYTGAYQALARVRPLEWKHHLPVPQEVRERVYAVSPAFSEIRTGIEGSIFKTAACSFEYIKHACGDLASGWFLFALRDAVAQAGYYNRGDRAEDYYKRLVGEVNAACDQGRLVCDSLGYGFVPPLSKVILGMAFDSLKELLARIVYLRGWALGPYPSSGYELFPYVAGMTHNRIAPTATEGRWLYAQPPNARALGWAYHRDGEVSIRVEADPKTFAGSAIKRVPRPDVEAAMKDSRAANAGFDIEYNCQNPCFFAVRTASGAEARFPVPRSPADKTGEANGFSIYYDHWVGGRETDPNVRIATPADLLGAFDATKLAWRTQVAILYQVVMPKALVVALIALALSLVWRAMRRRVLEPEILLLGFLIAATATRAIMIALLDAVLTAPNLSQDYISPTFTLYTLALALCIVLPFSGRRVRSVPHAPSIGANSSPPSTGSLSATEGITRAA